MTIPHVTTTCANDAEPLLFKVRCMTFQRSLAKCSAGQNALQGSPQRLTSARPVGNDHGCRPWVLTLSGEQKRDSPLEDKEKLNTRMAIPFSL